MLRCPEAFARISNRKNADPDPDSYIGRTKLFLVTECKERDIVVSHRAPKKRFAEAATKLWDELNVGDIKEGLVVGIKTLVYSLNLAAFRGCCTRPNSDTVRTRSCLRKVLLLTVRIKSIDKAKNRISLGLGAEEEDHGPLWEQIYRGEKYSGTVTRIVITELLSNYHLGSRVWHTYRNLSTIESITPEVW